MRKRSWLVAVALCAQSSLVAAQDRAPPAGVAEPPSHSPSAPAHAPPQPAAPQAPPDGQALYPAQGSSLPDVAAQGYPDADAEIPDDFGARRHRYEGEPLDPYRLSMQQRYPLKADVLIVVPIPVSDDHDSSKVGFGISGLFGWDLGFLLPTAGLGWSWSKLNLPAGYRDDDRSLKRIHLSLGLMAEFENKSIVTPVFGALVDFNFWHVAGDNSIACGGGYYYYWGCFEVEDYTYTTGFTFRAGIDVRFFRNDRFSLGTGVLPHVTLKGGPFSEAEWWISPYALFTIRS